MITLCFIAVLTLIGVSSYHVLQNRRQYTRSNQIIDSFISFVADQDNCGNTALDKSIDNIIKSISQQQASIIVASMRGTAGGAVRSTTAALESEAIETIPEAAILSALPKKIQKNPIAQMGLASVIQKIMQGNKGRQNLLGEGNGTQPRFNL